MFLSDICIMIKNLIFAIVRSSVSIFVYKIKQKKRKDFLHLRGKVCDLYCWCMAFPIKID